MSPKPHLLIAASGTGGHLFPALAVAQQFPNAKIDWLGVPNRLETTLVPQDYPLHTINVEGFQQRGIKSLFILQRLITSVWRVWRLLGDLKIDAVFTTGGYIAAPAILAARLRGIPVILHEANAIPGKVTRLLAPLCHTVAIGFSLAGEHLPKPKTVWVSTPVRSEFLTPQPLDDFPIPDDAPLIVILGGSQGAVAVNQRVRDSAKAWLETGAYMVHLTGDRDPDAETFQHPHYFARPFYDNVAGLLQRANLAISRAGAGTLTELAVTKTPSLLIPYPFAAEDHQFYNAKAFQEAGAAWIYRQDQLTAEILEKAVLELLNAPSQLTQMAEKAGTLAVIDSAEQIANLVRKGFG
ncbi:undecaprenyldiphospho-muramoylpentapeptide beta-N-acetylglucosaminyltransferase [Spirulina sp. CS-785/01]|uniref:undecaprenyldiphospho-muramoylpentapeptide beta-N-acetylglucosaminyltransferase n=1 Tax=Spirulina sp. CS-785/01 TaxID=3021716 RepID=UPI0023300C74|nr:undecaprenyldiphospho-muramoylpentapeptide beta-N-acetylglucosaminyltransferase [Spirulina sp. CS-785/01]MDB9314271.1 undecaprenyldiphospho-muramoylpentapeptide beta-N-acetylglucosaminyltransferase [Spirulina sp. CS-785/01]